MRTSRIIAALALLQCQTVLTADAGQFAVQETLDRLVITYEGRPVTEFVFRNTRILRPYFANIHAPGGDKVTRNHPPLAGQDATDHDTMHPGLWLAFGDVNGQDFWRNKARIEHVGFVDDLEVVSGQVSFVTQCRLMATNGALVGTVKNRFTVTDLTNAWMIIWEATFLADSGDITFGDQEEMGFGARLATGITEQNGGIITSSSGLRTATRTWGQPADWCNYSVALDGRHVGMILMADPGNFRPSWWHNRDYGLLVANPFGRDAMKQGTRSAVLVKRGEEFRLRFGAAAYSATRDPHGSEFYRQFLARAKNRSEP